MSHRNRGRDPVSSRPGAAASLIHLTSNSDSPFPQARFAPSMSPGGRGHQAWRGVRAMHRRVATAGLVAFLAIDVALVALALRTGRDAPTALPPVTPTQDRHALDPGDGRPPPRPPPDPRPRPRQGQPPSSAAAGAAPVSRLVSALDAATAWRASAGSCVAGGARRRGHHRRRRDVDQGAARPHGPSRASSPSTQTRAFVVGAGTDCDAQAVRHQGRSARPGRPPTPVIGGLGAPPRRADAGAHAPRRDGHPVRQRHRRRPLAHLGHPGRGPLRRRLGGRHRRRRAHVDRLRHGARRDRPQQPPRRRHR